MTSAPFHPGLRSCLCGEVQCGILKTTTLVQDVHVVQPLRSVQAVSEALVPRACEGLV
jgi:hypothetical protein